jgi:hypothetical protein
MPFKPIMPFPRKSRVGLADDDVDSANDYGETKDLAERKKKAQAAREVFIVVPEGETEGRYHAMAMQARNKMGHSFCGVCCDMRRTVITLNIMVLLLVVASFACLALIEEVRFSTARFLAFGKLSHLPRLAHIYLEMPMLNRLSLMKDPGRSATTLCTCGWTCWI